MRNDQEWAVKQDISGEETLIPLPTTNYNAADIISVLLFSLVFPYMFISL